MKRILIVKLGALGDVVRSSYLLPALYEKYTAPAIYWLTAADAVDLLRFNPYITSLVTPGEELQRIRSQQFDLLLSLDEETEILASLAGLKCDRVIGAALAGEMPSYSPEAASWFDMGLISRFGKTAADQLKLANQREHHTFLEEMLGIRISGPSFYNAPLIEQRAARHFAPDHFAIGVNSGAGGRWPSKQLPIDETIRLIRELLSLTIAGRQVRVYLLGAEHERERHAEVLRQLASPCLVDTGCCNSLLEFAAIIKCCDYVISSDSLSLHLAIAQGVANLSYYAPTSAAEIGTFGTGVKVVSTAADYCSYRADADNSSLTAERLLGALRAHLRL